MKKRIVFLSILTLLVCMLTGCGHTHAWQEATCEIPKTCTACGETEGEALGHSWQEAACETPSVCAVCSETGEEARGHVVYAVPIVDDETGIIYVTGTCKTCGQENCHAEYSDWETLALKWAVGEWQFTDCMTLADFNTFVPEEMAGDGFVFREDGSAAFVFEGKRDEGKWAYLTTKGAVTTVWCYFESTGGTVCEFCFSPMGQLGWYNSDGTFVMRYQKT